MIKSFLEPQVLFTVGLTAGASLVKQLSQDGGNHLFYSACFLKTGRDKSLNSKSSGPRIFVNSQEGYAIPCCHQMGSIEEKILHAIQRASTL